MKVLFSFLLLVFLGNGCASKKKQEANPIALAEKFFDLWKDFGQKIKEADSSDLVVQKAKLSGSYSLAVYFIQPADKKQTWRWDRKDKDVIINTLATQRKTSRVFELINTGSGEQSDIKNLRMMAAQQGAEALLLMRGASTVNSDLNGKALSYIALVPMLFVTGNDVNSTFVGQAIVLDVKTPYVHLGLESEGTWEMERPLAFRQTDRALEKSKEQALKSLGQKLKEQLPQLTI